eukprot:m.15746 g.15746  ORF g.15746 m.15746 type:complete len:386 (+) comp26522_c0_seq1:376-1533(+)
MATPEFAPSVAAILIAVVAVVSASRSADADPPGDNELEDPWNFKLPDLLYKKARENNKVPTPKAPRYMTRLYRMLTNVSRPLAREDERNLPHICYLGLGPSPYRPGSVKFHFNTSIETQPPQSVVIPATVQSARLLLKFTKDPSTMKIAGRRSHIKVTVSQIIRIRKDKSYRLSKIGERRMSVKKATTSYVEFDARGAYMSWLTEPKKNFGLLVQLSSGRRKSELTIPTVVNDPNERPLLIVLLGSASRRRSKRDGRQRRGAGDRLSESPQVKIPKSSRHFNRKNSACSRKPFQVNLKDIGWSFIIAPLTYDAAICNGSCVAPLIQHHNPSTHSIVLSTLPKKKRPKACCVATELEPVRLMFFDRNDVIIYKPFDDMKASACGCR